MRNWREPDDYQFTAKLDDKGWAWEFLRRNPDYRKDFTERLNKFLSLRKAGKLGLADSGREVDDPRFYVPYDPEFGALVDFKRWGCRGYCHPDQDHPEMLIFFPPGFNTRYSVFFPDGALDFMVNPEAINRGGTRKLELAPGA